MRNAQSEISRTYVHVRWDYCHADQVVVYTLIHVNFLRTRLFPPLWPTIMTGSYQGER